MNCSKCLLYVNQLPLYDKTCMKADVMWIGLSAKMYLPEENIIPLDVSTNTGKIIRKIEEVNPEFRYYKSNLVKCAPIDTKGKLRYPTNKEMNLCFPLLCEEIQNIAPSIIFLLGTKVSKFILKKCDFSSKITLNKDFIYQILPYKNTKLVSVHHPAYISVYRHKKESEYVNAISNIIRDCLQHD